MVAPDILDEIMCICVSTDPSMVSVVSCLSKHFRSLMMYRFDYAFDSQYPLRRACQRGQVKAIEFLFSMGGVDPNINSGEIIVCVALSGNLDVARELLTANIESEYIDAAVNSALWINDYAMAELFLCDRRCKCTRELFLGRCHGNDIQLIKLLLSIPNITKSIRPEALLRGLCTFFGNGGIERREVMKIILDMDDLVLQDEECDLLDSTRDIGCVRMLLADPHIDPIRNAQDPTMHEYIIDKKVKWDNPILCIELLRDPRIKPWIKLSTMKAFMDRLNTGGNEETIEHIPLCMLYDELCKHIDPSALFAEVHKSNRYAKTILIRDPRMAARIEMSVLVKYSIPCRDGKVRSLAIRFRSETQLDQLDDTGLDVAIEQINVALKKKYGSKIYIDDTPEREQYLSSTHDHDLDLSDL